VGPLLAQAHVHALTLKGAGQLSFPMHMVALTLPVASRVYANQLFLYVGPGRTTLTVTLHGHTYRAVLITFPASGAYGTASFCRASALSQLRNTLLVGQGQAIATALNRLFCLN
jgi:hypothetical protein